MTDMLEKLQFNQSANRMTPFFVISRETERFGIEIHDHKEEVRSSDELLGNLKESERNEPYEEKVTTRSKETWAAPSTKETRAGLSALFQGRHPYRQGELSMPTSHKEELWHCRFPKRSQQCCVILTKRNDRLMVQDIGDSIKSVLVKKFAHEGYK